MLDTYTAFAIAAMFIVIAVTAITMLVIAYKMMKGKAESTFEECILSWGAMGISVSVLSLILSSESGKNAIASLGLPPTIGILAYDQVVAIIAGIVMLIYAIAAYIRFKELERV